MRILTVVAVSLALAAAQAEEKQNSMEKFGDLGKGAVLSSKASPTRSAASSGSGVRVMVASNSTIQPGAFMDYGQLSPDFGGAESVEVAISAAAPNANLSGTTILLAWAAPNEFFVVTDTIKGNSLAFQDSGGGKVSVYGSGLRILVANDGTAPITIKQLTVYAYVH